MPRAATTCSVPGCPTLVFPSGRCPEHKRQADKARGSRQQRGYDTAYDRQRRAWAPTVAAGHVTCWRCAQPIRPGTPWTLGHDDHDRSVIRGPEHARCGYAAAGRAAHH